MTEDFIHSSNLQAFASIVSYLPVALYAESLRLSSAIILAASSQRTIIPPITGCIKDIDRLWNLSVQQLLSEFNTQQYVAASLRHGNTFNLSNSSLLTRSGLVGRSRDSAEINEQVRRPTILHLTYLYPRSDDYGWRHQAITLTIHLLEAALLIAFSSSLLSRGLWIGGAAILCILINLLLFCLLQHASSFVFGNKYAVASDTKLTTADGAALDIHVIAENWNASEIDVLIGYSSHLHALTNILVLVKNWKVVKYVSRAVVVVATIQAALLASLASRSDKQVWGSLFWLICYAILQLPSTITIRRQPAVLFDSQPLVMEKVPPLVFTGRRTALAFIGSLPMTEPRSQRWDWLDGFMPPNERRAKWQTDIVAAGLDTEVGDLEHGKQEGLELEVYRLVRDVRAVRANKDFARVSRKFSAGVKFRKS